MLPASMPYEADSAVTLRVMLPCEADPAAILLLAANINSEIPERGLAGYRSAGSINRTGKRDVKFYIAALRADLVGVRSMLIDFARFS